MRRLFTLTLLFLILSIPSARASAPAHRWSHRFGGTLDDAGQALAVDPARNVYLAGVFQGTMNLGSGDLVSAGGTDIFLAKYNSFGVLQWSKRFGNTNEDYLQAVAADNAGNVIITGSFTSSVDFGGGVLVSAGSADAFVASFDTNGNYNWSKRFGDVGYDTGTSVAVDGSGQVVVTGTFSGSVWFGGGPVQFSSGSDDAFLAKFTASSGAYVWGMDLGGSGDDGATSVAVDSGGNIALTGYFHGTAVFGGFPIVSNGGADVFLVRFTPGASHVFSTNFGGASDDFGRRVAFDSGGNILLAGTFESTANLGGFVPLVTNGNADVFLAKYDSFGTFAWSKGLGGTASDVVRGMAADGANNIVITGYFQGPVNFGGGDINGTGFNSIYLAGYDGNGQHLYSEAFGATTTAEGHAIAIDNTNSIVLAGAFVGDINLGGLTFSSGGENYSAEGFLARFSQLVVPVLPTTIPQSLSIASYPNPFNPRTTLSYTVPARGAVNVSIFDARGTRVATLVHDEAREAGAYQVGWNGRSDDGIAVSSGVYFARIQMGIKTDVRKIVLLK